MKKFLFLTLMVSFISAACPNNNYPVPIEDGGSCGVAEKHLQDLCNKDRVTNKRCCELVKPTLKGKTFNQFCQETLKSGISLNPGCLAQILECGEEIDRCTAG